MRQKRTTGYVFVNLKKRIIVIDNVPREQGKCSVPFRHEGEMESMRCVKSANLFCFSNCSHKIDRLLSLRRWNGLPHVLNTGEQHNHKWQ